MENIDTMASKFRAKMEQLDNEAIIAAIDMTWDEPYGAYFREWGFDILEVERGMSEDEADELYAQMWHRH